jgi:periplasmic protein TonB
MRVKLLLHVFSSFLLLILCQIARAEPMLNGIGAHHELGQEVFIGALYSESLSNDADTLINNAQPMRMELKIVAPDGLTNRRFSRMWIEGMAVNSKPDVLTAQADNMVKFDGLFKGRFLSGDVISFSNNPGKGVDIAVNGAMLGNIEDSVFFSMLLSTWIGKIPLSSDYRDSLLKVGDVDAGLRGRYTSIAPTATRKAEVTTWAGAQQVVVKETAQTTSSKASTAAQAGIAAAGVGASVAIAKPELPKLDVPAIEKPALDIPAPVTQAEKPAAVASAPVADEPKIEEDEEDGPALTAQSLLARQFYVSDAIKKIRSRTKYPQRAQVRGQVGNVRVAITIDRQGNILSTNILESSKFDLLNKEAIDAVNRSAPFTELPAEMPGARFEFSVPMRWSLSE